MCGAVGLKDLFSDIQALANKHIRIGIYSKWDINFEF